MQLNRIAKWCVAIAAAINTTCSIAAECLAPKVIFVNGVLNSRTEARAGQVELRKALIEGGAPADLSVGAVYSPTDPGLDDLLEVAQDYQLTQGHLSFVNAILTAAYAVPPLTGASALLTTWLGQQISSTAPNIRNINVETAIRNAILHEIRDNQRPVIVVAHSQGNIYVNNVVRQLKSMTSSIKGIQSIGVVGIGVASTVNLGTSFHPDLYRYVTRGDDLVITPLSGSLPSNMKSMDIGGGQNASGSGHLLIEDYLTSQITGDYDGIRQTPRNVVKKIFNEVYAAVSELFPCVDNGATVPAPILADEPVTLTAKTVSRDGSSILTGSVEFKDGNGVALCASTLDGEGRASCSHTFSVDAIPQKISAQWTFGVFDSSPLVFDVKKGQPTASFLTGSATCKYDTIPCGLGYSCHHFRWDYVWTVKASVGVSVYMRDANTNDCGAWTKRSDSQNVCTRIKGQPEQTVVSGYGESSWYSGGAIPTSILGWTGLWEKNQLIEISYLNFTCQ